MDLKSPHRVGDNIDKIPGGGYDHTYVLNKTTGKSRPGVYHKGTGIYLELETTEPGVQFYTGNMLTGTLVGKKGKIYAGVAASAWRHNIFRTHPISRLSLIRSCARVKLINKQLFTVYR